MACKCYHAERNWLGKMGVCWGTKEREACSCGGDESKCDFYDDVRKRATLKTTNADRIRAMTDEELAEFLDGVRIDWYNSHYPLTETGANGWREWLKQEATE